MSFSESVDLEVNSNSSGAAQDLRDVGKAAKDAQEAVDKLDQADVDIAIDDAELPSVKQALEDIRDEADKLDQEEISVDVDTTGLDNLDTAARTAATGVERVRDSGDKTKGVMSNLTGNAVQDLGSLAGVGGSAGVALGQLAERASEGGINLRSIGGAIGGIAGVGVALEYATSLLDVVAKTEAWDKKKVEDYKAAILEGATAVEALHDALVEAEGVQAKMVLEGGLAALPWGDDSQVEDITDKVVSLGLSVDTYSQLAAGGKTKIEEWAQAQVDAGADAEDVRTVMFALADEHRRLEQAAAAAKVTQQFLGEEFDNTKPKVDSQTKAVLALSDAYRQLASNAGVAVPTIPSVPLVGAIVNNNYHPPDVSPRQVQLAQQEYTRVQTGPR